MSSMFNVLTSTLCVRFYVTKRSPTANVAKQNKNYFIIMFFQKKEKEKHKCGFAVVTFFTC